MRLSEFRYLDILLESYDNIEKIVFEQNKHYTNQRCDIGVVFGGISMIPYRADKALDLYEKGLINKILLSGGIGYFNKDRKIPEAIKLYNYLYEKGVPKNDMIIESKSKNTLENVKFFLELLKEQYNLNNTTLNLITSSFHMKRCLGLTEMYIKKNNLIESSVNDGITDLENWQNNLYGKKIILTEALSLCYYAKHKMIRDIDIKNYVKKYKK